MPNFEKSGGGDSPKSQETSDNNPENPDPATAHIILNTSEALRQVPSKNDLPALYKYLEQNGKVNIMTINPDFTNACRFITAGLDMKPELVPDMYRDREGGIDQLLEDAHKLATTPGQDLYEEDAISQGYDLYQESSCQISIVAGLNSYGTFEFRVTIRGNLYFEVELTEEQIRQIAGGEIMDVDIFNLELDEDDDD